MYTFDLRKFDKVVSRCLIRFSHNKLIVTAINALESLFYSGSGDSRKVTLCQIGNGETLGVRILAANILAVMYREAFKESGGDDISLFIECVQRTKEPDGSELKTDLSGKMSGPVWLDEPELAEWCEVFNIPFSLKVDLNLLCQTNG